MNIKVVTYFVSVAGSPTVRLRRLLNLGSTVSASLVKPMLVVSGIGTAVTLPSEAVDRVRGMMVIPGSLDDNDAFV